MRRFYWTLEKSILEAELYSKSGKTRAEFKRERHQAHKMLFNNNLLDNYFERKHAIHGTWKTYENCYMAAKQCNSKTEFQKQYPQAYKQSCNNYTENNIKWIDTFDCFPKDKRLIKDIHKYWTDEKLKEEVNKYNSLSSIPKNLYTALYKRYGNTVLNVFPHLRNNDIDYSKRNNLVYIYSFSGLPMTCYVGRTTIGCLNNTKSRHKTSNKDAVYKYSIKTNALPIFKIVAHNLTIEESKQTEDLWRKELTKIGYNILNIAPTGDSSSIGSLGGGIWKKDKIIELIQKNNIRGRKELYLVNNPAYNSAKKNGWLDEWFPKYTKY